MTETYWPLLLYALLVAVIAAIMLLSSLLGERHRERATVEPYESGMPVTGTPRIRFDVGFYLIAVFFVIFDVEAVFVFAWAIGMYELGWAGYIEICIFIGLLFATLVYLWRVGALEILKNVPSRRIVRDESRRVTSSST